MDRLASLGPWLRATWHHFLLIVVGAVLAIVGLVQLVTGLTPPVLSPALDVIVALGLWLAASYLAYHDLRVSVPDVLPKDPVAALKALSANTEAFLSTQSGSAFWDAQPILASDRATALVAQARILVADNWPGYSEKLETATSPPPQIIAATMESRPSDRFLNALAGSDGVLRAIIADELPKRTPAAEEVVSELTRFWTEGGRGFQFPVSIPYDHEVMQGAIDAYNDWVERCADYVREHRPAYLLKVRDAGTVIDLHPLSNRMAGQEDDDGKMRWYDYRKSGDYEAAISRVRAVLREIIEAGT